MNLRHLFLASVFFLSSFLTFLSGAPIVSQVTPNAGPQAGGTAVSIIGTGFTGTTAVNFGSTPAASFVVNSDNLITAISPPAVFGTVNISVTTGSGTSSISAGDRFVFQGTWLGYVTTETIDQAIPFTIPGNVVGTPVSLAGSVPVDIAITPDGKTAYVSTITQGVKVIDILTNAVIATIPVGTAPFGVAITPDGTKVFVANIGGASVSVIDTSTNTVVATIPISGDPAAVAITPDGTTAYVSVNSPASSVVPINVATNTTGTPILLGGSFDIRFLTINPNGQSLYVGRATPGPLFVINIPTNTVATTIPLSVPTDGLFRLAVTPDGTKGLATTETNGNIYPLNLIANTAGTPFAITGASQGIAITPNGVTAYVTNQGNQIFPIDVATNTVGAPLIVTGNSTFIAITPDQAPLATFVTVSGPGTTTFFDASSSVSPVGTIVSYAWNFGDGQTAVTSSPFTSHTYATNGIFNVTLAVTNSAGTSTVQTFPGTTMLQNGGINAIFSQLVNVGIGLGPLPPSDFIGRQTKNIFATQTELINQLTWQPSPDLTIIGYFIRRNGVIIANIPAQGPFFFLDHNRRKHEIYVYTLTAFSATGESTPLTLTLP